MAKKLYAVLLVGLVLAIGLTVPVQASDNVTYQWMSWENPLYPDMPLPDLPNTRAVRKQPVCRDTLQEAAADLREGLKNREETIAVIFMAPRYEKQLISELFDAALAHTGDPTEGDYIQWHYSGWSADIGIWHLENMDRIEVTFHVAYLTTAQQEQELDAAVKKLLDQLNVYDAGDYEKVCAIYDYMCENIQYDYSYSKQAHSAYAALVHGKAVCQGYASLFYRLALALDVDARVISGIGNGGAHGWNIVRLGGRYYDLDATWDAPRKQNGQPYEYYLRCDANFLDHTRDQEYLTEEFLQTYLMALEDYTQDAEILLGDLDGNVGVTEDDAIYLLQSVLMPEFFPLNQAADYSRDGKVSEDDAIYLLQHVLMPEVFPL